MLEGQYDLFGRNTCRKQVGRDAFLRPVLLNPELAVPDIDMYSGTMNSFEPVPAFIEDKVMPLLPVEYRSG